MMAMSDARGTISCMSVGSEESQNFSRDIQSPGPDPDPGILK
jgi:hypothetical protein